MGLFVIIFIGLLLILLKRIKEIGYLKLFFLIISVILLPIISLSLYFVSNDVYYHMLMVMSLIVFYYIPVLFYDSFNVRDVISSTYSWLTVIILTLTIFNFALVSNISYLNLNLKYERTFALANRVLDRMEQTENFEGVDKIAIIGNPNRYIYSPFSEKMMASKLPEMTGVFGNVFIFDSKRFSNMFDQYLGIELNAATDGEISELEKNSAVNEMGVWPTSDSVTVIDDIVIIKFPEN